MYIAICDDTKKDADKIRFALMDITDELEMVWFDTGEKLIESIRKGCFYSLIFQDIYLENESGMEIAQTVRELSPDTQIIFVTTSLDHAVDAFRVQAVDYLVKPCSETDIAKAFVRVNVKMNNQAPAPVIINIGREIRVFHPDKVIKLESDRHYTVIHHHSGQTDRVHKNFSDIAGLFENRFIELRRGLLVNPQYIERINGSAVILADKSTYVLPKAKKDSVIATYTEYITSVKNKR